MSVKKAKKKAKAAGKKSAKTSARTKKTKDVVQVRENINDLVKESAEDIATEVIKVAKTGQLASAKYLFEVVGLYPATEQTAVMPVKDTLAHTLLTRMGLPLEPVVTDEDLVPVLPSGARGKSAEPAVAKVADEGAAEERAEEDVSVSAEGEE